ncbi:hypothetical protein F5Y00DRAFT_268817 [Daldinia vernicosa]|uniref:uncharacterized protein n=1 Tax=Daldinia vernicosa TaxID=114800 RepID=UPI002007DA13|nr:uncharacterized protein F5Y00DRAFT_268817 [Daldinia vernicosa]KAI0849726.1 hypothetical protein F5Y00DRAFT_268817 [Daldinia vernicosa]
MKHSILFPIWLGTFQLSNCNTQDLRVILTDPKNEWAPTTAVSFPDSQAFTNATLRWDIYAPPTYVAAISPGTAADVVKSVKLARSHNISILATGGRHGYTTTFKKLQNGLAIDLSKLDTVNINQHAETVTVGGGVRVGQIFDPVYNAGFELQTITSQCPGMIGSTLGAGVGRDEGRYGLAIDALQSVRLVTADARLIDVSATSHADLFWAIRGAGANFGIIVSATYKLHNILNNDDYDGKVTNVDIIFPANMSATYFNTAVNSYNGSLPAKLSAETIVMYDAESNGAHLLANWVYFGPEAKAREIMAPILNLQSATISLSVVPWNQVANKYLFGTDPSNCAGGRSENVYGVNMKNMSPSTYQAAFEKMGQFYADHTDGRQALLSLEMFPNEAARAIPDAATAYPWRDTVAHLLILLTEAGTAGDELGRQIRSDFAATSGYPDLAVYVNYAHGDESLEQIYGRSQLPRLAVLKKTWDPDNVFGFNNALPTQYP